MDFYQEVLLAIVIKYKNKEKVSEIVQQLVEILCLQNSFSTKLYFLLLRLNENKNFSLELAGIQLNKALMSISEGKFLNFGRLLD